MDLGLKGKVAFVGGSSRGIGRAIAEAFLREGCRTVVTGRDSASLDRAASQLASAHGAELVLPWRGDLSGEGAVRAVAFVSERWGAPDALVANVGSGASVRGWDVPDEEWERAMRVNLFGSAALVRAVLPGMIERGSGSLVVVSSIAGIESISAPLPYEAAKAGLIAYAKGLARQVARHGIRVNAVAPGNVLFPGGSWERRLAEREEETRRFIAEQVPQGRFARPEEIADVVLYLCSERASFITGAVVVADGGQTRSW